MLEKILEELEREKNYAQMSSYAVVLLCRFLQTINFSAKKTIIKPFFTKNLLAIIQKNHLLIYLFLTFFSSITDKTVFSITAGKSIRNNLLATPLVDNKTAQHLLYLLSCKDIGNISAIDKKLTLNAALVSVFDIRKISEEFLFKENVNFFIKSIFSNMEIVPKPSQIIDHSSNNQNFSALIGNVLERILQGNLIR